MDVGRNKREHELGKLTELSLVTAVLSCNETLNKLIDLLKDSVYSPVKQK